MKLRLIFLLVLALTAVTTTAAQAAPDVSANIAITRTSSDVWRVDYTFSVPISRLDYGPAIVAYRKDAWRVLTPGVALESDEGGEHVVAKNSAITRLSIEVRRYPEFSHDRYVPIVSFTDGGAALYLGFFTGTAIIDGKQAPMNVQFRFKGLAGDNVLPAQAAGPNTYVYFGPQTPVQTAHARLIMDPGAPAWLLEAIVAVIEPATKIFAERLGGGLAQPPLVLAGAADLDSAEGASVKGGAIGDQFVMLLRGKGLRGENARKRSVFQRITAHELAHLWQLHMLPMSYNDKEPWLHEGSAEAMAVKALQQAGLWSAEQVDEFANQAAIRCEKALGDKELSDAAGNSEAGYACGFGLFWSSKADPMTIWSNLVEAVRRGAPYSLGTLRPMEAIFYAVDAPDALASFEKHARQVSVIAPQSYRVDEKGVLTGSVPAALLKAARRHQVRVMPLIVNPGWSTELFSALVNDSSARSRMVGRMVELGKLHGYWGWQLDFEQIHVRDRGALTRMVQEAARALHAAGMTLSIAVYPDPDPDADPTAYHTWIRELHTSAYDLKALSDAADFLSLMTYLQHGPRTPPGPVGGLPYMQRAVEHALSLGVPGVKLSLGIPLFSMHWSAQWSKEKDGFSGARGMRWTVADSVARSARATLAWDSVQGSNYARWEKSGTLEHAWIEDARAFRAKLDLQRKYGLRGISVWRIGQEDPAVWDILIPGS